MCRIRCFAYTVLCLFLILAWVPLCAGSGLNAANAGAKALKAGDRKKAKVLFKSALASNELSKENYVSVNNQLAELLRQEGDTGQALERYSESLYLTPDSPGGRMGRGILYHQLGEYEKAVGDFSRYTELLPRDPKGYIRRGMAFRELRNYDRALADLDHALWLRPGNGEAHIHRGNIYLKTRNYNLALSDFETARKIDPENPYAWQAAAWVYAACPNHDFRDGNRAVKLARKAMALEKTSGSDPLFPATLAAAYAQCGMYGRAVEAQRKAMARVPEGGATGGLSRRELDRRLRRYERGQSYRD